MTRLCQAMIDIVSGAGGLEAVGPGCLAGCNRSLVMEAAEALLTRRRLQRGAFQHTTDLEDAIRAYIAQTNTNPKPFVWTKPADAILASVERFCQRTSNSDH
jgi:hypothetical protein